MEEQNSVNMDIENETFKPQKTIVYNKHLPYHDRLAKEATDFLAQIKYNIGRAVLLREINPGLLVWCNHLHKYIRGYGNNFSKEDHILFIKLLYQLLVMPNLEAQFVKSFSYVLHKLIKKRELLTRDDLQLPWRPLYELVESVRYSYGVRQGLRRYQDKFIDSIHQVVRFARCYFPAEATKEMLVEWRPLMCPHDDVKRKAGYYFSKFLPTRLGPNEEGFQLWLDEFINYWLTCTQTSNVETLSEDYSRLFMRAAEHNVGHIDWNPYLPAIFNHFLSGLNLPVNGAVFRGNQRYKVICMNNYAKWFIYMIGGDSMVLDHLHKLFVVMKSFYHPSNYGKHSLVLQAFLHSLTVHLVKRLHNERFGKRSWITDTKPAAKVTDTEVERFVLMVKDVTLFCMYSKSGSYQAASAIQNLALLRADLILPPLLDKTYEALETLVEPHQVTATLSCITSVARVLVTGGGFMPDAPTHVLRLLYLVLPGIDPNDFRKSMSSFTLISSIVGLIPLVDCTPALHAGIEMTEVERELCYASAQFEDFILQFIDRCFVLIEMSTAEEIAEQDNVLIENPSAQENMIGMGMLSTVQTVLMQSSPKLFESILESLFNFVSSRVLEVKVSGKMVSDLCRAASKTNAEVALKKFIPFICSTVKNLASVPGVQDEEHSDLKLLWYLEILSEMIRCDGKALLPYKEMLKEVIHLTIHLKCKKAYSRSGKLLKAVLSSCSSLYVTEWCSIAGGFADPPEEHFYIRDWGKPGDVDNLQVHWHVPDAEELAFADELLREFLLPELEMLKSYMNGSHLTRDELHQRLQIIGVAVVGTSCMLPEWENEPMAGREPFSLVSRDQFSHSVAVESLEAFRPCISRKDISLVTHEFFEYMLKNNENDTKAFRIIAKIYDFLVLHHGLNNREYNMRWKTAVAVKKVLADNLHGNKLHLRAILIERVQLQHDMRLISKRLPRYTVMDEMIVNDLLILSTSDYTEVRVDAQKVLFGCFEALDFSVRSVLPTLLKNLKPENEISHEKLKGTLYVLLYSRVLHLITQYWEFMELIWPAIVCLDQSEKPSIIALTGRLVTRIQSKFETLSLSRSMTEECRQLAECLILTKNPTPHGLSDTTDSNSPMPSNELLLKGKEMLDKHNSEHLGFYRNLEEQLISCVEDPTLHWRCVEIGLKLMVLMFNEEIKAPVRTAKIIVNMLVHDSLKLRMVAIKGLHRILIQQKRSLPKRQIPLSSYGVDDSVDSLLNIPPGDSRDDSKWLQYRPDDVPLSQQDLERTIYMDKMHIGYYAYPAVITTYESHDILNKYTCDVNALGDVEQVIYNTFCQVEFCDKFFKLISLEKKKEEDAFSQDNFMMFKALFRHFQSEFLKKCEPHVTELLAEQDSESKQRCCSEVLSGCMSGAKNWNFEQLTYMWNFVGTQIKSVYDRSIIPEILRDWGHGFSVATGNRDPNRFHSLYKILLDNPICGSGGSLGDSSRLYIMQCVLSEQEWRASEMFHHVYNYLLQHLSHPFKSVRDRIGFLLSYILIPDLENKFFKPTLSPHLKDFVDHVIDDLHLTCKEVLDMDMQKKDVDVPMETCSLEEMHDDEASMDCKKNGLIDAEDEDRKRRDRLAKTVLSFLISRSCVMQPLSPDIYRLVQVLIPLEAREDDPEIVTFCKTTFPRLSSKQIPDDIIDIALTSIIATCNSSSWNARRTGLNFLKNMVYHNLFTFDNDAIRVCVVDVVLARLQDEQLEIREVASSLLSGLIHFDYIPVTQELLDGFLASTHRQVYKIRYGVHLTPEQQAENVVSLRLRHAGLLGLQACVLAFPYVVTLWMPEILLEVGKHLHGSPQVQDVVKKTLLEFRRTHHDSWHTHRQKFTDDQLTVLTDLLVSPSYYA